MHPRNNQHNMIRERAVRVPHYFIAEVIMQIHWQDIITVGNLILLFGIYRKVSIMVYQHKLMWADFAQKKGLDVRVNGKAAAAGD